MEIKFEHVDFSYQKVNCVPKEIFHDLNISISSGKIHGIVGAIGSGKTTFLELIDTLLLPNCGKICVGDFVIDSSTRGENLNNFRFQIGFVPQNFENQFFNETVFDELAFNLRYYQYHLSDIKKRVSDSLRIVGLKDSYINRELSYLSNGEKCKVAIASVLIYNPKILLLDEPTRGLDGRSKDDLIKLLRILKNRYHKTILIASHDTDFLHRIVDEIHVIYDKGIVLSGNKYEVFKNIKQLRQYGVKSPRIIEFSNRVLQKQKIKIGYRDEINDLIKDIYRYVK